MASRKEHPLTAPWPLPDDDPMLFAYNSRQRNSKKVSPHDSHSSKVSKAKVGKYVVSYAANAFQLFSVEKRPTEDTSSSIPQKEPTMISNKDAKGERDPSIEGAEARSVSKLDRKSPLVPISVLKEREREREQTEGLAKVKPFLKPLRNSPSEHNSPKKLEKPKWEGAGVPEPVFSYGSLDDPNLQGYYLRSQNARKALVSHGVLTEEGTIVEMHHIGGQIWLGEKRHQKREQAKQLAEDRLQTEQVHDRQRQLEALAMMERSGKVNRMRVASHIAYTRKREGRNQAREALMRERLAKQQAKRAALEGRSRDILVGESGDNFPPMEGRQARQIVVSGATSQASGSVAVSRSPSRVRTRSNTRGNSLFARKPSESSAKYATSAAPIDWSVLAMVDPQYCTSEVKVAHKEFLSKRRDEEKSVNRPSFAIEASDAWSEGAVTPQQDGL